MAHAKKHSIRSKENECDGRGTLPIIGAARGIPSWIALARPVVQGQFVFVLIAFLCLGYSFVSSDFSVMIVAKNSNSELPFHFRLAATWGSHEGSLLLWVLMLAGWYVAVMGPGACQ